MAPALPRNGGDIDDTAAAAFEHGTRRGLGTQKRASQIHAELQLPLFQRGREERLVEANAGVVDENVELLKARDGLLDQSLDLGRLTDIDVRGHRISAAGDVVSPDTSGAFDFFEGLWV